jgi:hypothetical protein
MVFNHEQGHRRRIHDAVFALEDLTGEDLTGKDLARTHHHRSFREVVDEERFATGHHFQFHAHPRVGRV